MADESRRSFILNALKNNTVAEVVHIDPAVIIELIGLPLTEELAIYCTEMKEQIAPLPSPNSAIPKEKSFKKSGMSGFKRLELIEALESGTVRGKASTTPETAGSDDAARAVEGPGELPRGSDTSTENSADPALGS